MNVFTAILGNNLRRLGAHISRLLLFLVLTAAAIAAALFVNAKAEIAGHVAVVAPSEVATLSTNLNITLLEAAPPLSELVSGKYDAVIIFDASGRHEIRTIKSDDFKDLLETILSDPSSHHTAAIRSRGHGTNIIGFLIMFIFMQGVSMMFMFAEDKEKKQIKRIAASPVSFTGYLCAHSFFAFAFLLVPIMSMLLVARLLGVEIGLGLMDYFLLLSLICALSTSFALFLVALFAKSDTSNMLGSAISVLTSLLAGGFYAFDKGNKALEGMIKVLPQKAFLSMSDMIEQGKAWSTWVPHGLYVFALTVFFFVAAIIKTRKDHT